MEPYIQVAEEATFNSLKEHRTMLGIDCLYSGNVSENHSTNFVTSATTVFANKYPTFGKVLKHVDSYRPGALTRPIIPEDDVLNYMLLR